jgi:predicted TIM-barrel fold metal-dependent hydrolase
MKLDKNVIDTHFHINAWYDKFGNNYIDLLNDIQKKTDLKGININALTHKKHGGVKINIMAAIYKLYNPSVYAHADIFFPATPVPTPLDAKLLPEIQYDDFMEIGFDGIKILYKPDVQKIIDLPINSITFDKFFKKCEKDKTHVIWHVADPKIHWTADFPNKEWNYSDGTFPSFDELFNHTFDVLNKYPSLNVCFAHFMFMEETPEKLEEIFKRYENVAVDVVPGLMFREFEKRPEFYREFLSKYSDRILFGSDSEIPANSHSIELINAIYDGLTTDKEVNIWGYKSKGINLSDSVSEKILYKNFASRCSDTPKPINKSALKKYIEKYSDYIEESPEKAEILKFAKSL